MKKSTLSVAEMITRVLSARLANDHELVVYYMNELNSRAQLWSFKTLLEDLANTAENVYRSDA